jgi:hypothetical protein
METDEFFIGVKNLLVDKSTQRPKWGYERLEYIDLEKIREFLKHDDASFKDMF